MKVAGQPLVFIIDNKDEVGLCPLSKSMNELGAYKDVDLETLVKKPSINLIEGNGYRLPLINLIPKKDVGQLSRIDLNQSFSVLNHTRTMLVSLVPAERFNLDYVMSLHGPTTLLLPFNDLAPRSDLVDPKALNPLPKTANGIALSKQLRFSALKDQKNVWKIKLPDLEKLKVPVGIKEL